MKRILVALDGSPLAESILPTVGDLGRRSGAEIVLLHVVQLPPDVSTTEARIGIDQMVAHQEREASSYLRRIAAELTAENLTARTLRAIGGVATEIARAAEREHADVIALSTHGRSGMQRWLYGSVTDAVLQEATRPVLVVRPHPGGAAIERIHHVVAALDGSAVAERALAPARDLALGLGVPLALLRVVDPLPAAFAGGPFSGAGTQTFLASLEAEADAYLASVATRERRTGLPIEVVRKTGAPVEFITCYAEANPHDLVVLATHGRTGWRAAVMGNVARRVLLLAPGPILIVPVHAPDAVAPV